MVRAALGINSVAQRNAKATVPAALAGVFEGMTKNEWLTQCLPHVPVTLVWQRAGSAGAGARDGGQNTRVPCGAVVLCPLWYVGRHVEW